MKQDNHNLSNNKPASIPIAVVGISCIFPKAANLSEYWSNIKNGTDSITEVPPTHWQKEDYFDSDPKMPDCTYTTRGGFIDPVDFDPLEFGITPNALEATDTSQLLGLVAAKNALEDAGYGENMKDFDRDKVSVILGVTGTLELVIPLGARLSHPAWRRALKEAGVDDDVANDVVERISDSYVDWQENSFPGLLGNVAAGRIANRLDLRGTNCVVDAACASSLSAMHMALLELSAGRSDMVITGGLDTFNDIFMYMCFSKTMVLSHSGDARPFDRDGDGTILGEGLGMLVLKRLDDAERDKDKIYAVIKGVGTSSDGKGNAVYVPSSSGQAKALRSAYEQAGVTPDSIELVEAHGTGTKVGDASEVDALTEVFSSYRDDGKWCALGSVKAQIGHTKAAAGIAGLIKVIMALRNKVIPPTIKVRNPIEILTGSKTPFYINTEARPWISKNNKVRRAAASAFGFGGSNFHCVVEEYEQDKISIDWNSNIEMLCFSNDVLNGLKNCLKEVIDDFSWKKLLERATTSRADFSVEHAYRLVAVIDKDKLDDIKQALSSALDMLGKQPQKEYWNTPDGIHFSCRTQQRKLGIVFSGQGSQYVGMQSDLACQFPQMQKSLIEANSVFEKSSSSVGGKVKSLTDYIYPMHSFDESEQKADDEELQNTKIAQPAIGAVSMGMLDILSCFGVKPDVLAGHSYGELTALCAASCFDAETFFDLSCVRGELMADSHGAEGGMIAVWLDDRTVSGIMKKESVDLVIANKNAPNQTVLSGALNEIKKISSIFTKLNIRYKQLSVSSAFHSPFMTKVAKPFYTKLVESDFNSFETAVFANKTAEQYPANLDDVRKILSEQIISPVEFVKQVENMYESGVNLFLEVGPGNKLSGLIKSILSEKEHEACSMDASSGKNSGIYDLASTLARLAVGGVNVDLAKWNEGLVVVDTSKSRSKKPSLILPICGSNYVKPGKKKKPASLPRRVPEQNKALIADMAISNTGSTQQISDIKTIVNNVKQFGTGSARVQKVPAGDKSAITEMFRINNEHMITLQKMQEQTAKLHQQFLENQDSSLRSLATLMEQQRQLLGLPAAGINYAASVPASEGKFEIKEEPVSTMPKQHKVEPVQQTVVEDDNNDKGAVSLPATGEVCEALLSVVSEKTGYPIEMLDMDMSLDSDLGIDSIKRVEILSALQEKLPDAPEVKPEHMGVLSTLRQIIDFLSTTDDALSGKHVDTNVGNTNSSQVQEVLLEVVSEKTGYPIEMLELEMSLDSDLGIDSIKRVEILSALQEKLPDAPEVKPEHMGVLNTLGQIIAFISETDGASGSTKDSKGAIVGNDANDDKVMDVLLEIVSEKTGYPVEMIDVNMNLDSELGIDSIKRVEILSALQDEMPELPEIKPEHMGVLNTLKQISDFLTKPSGINEAEPVVIVAEKSLDGDKIIDVDEKSIGNGSIERSELCSVVLDRQGKEQRFSLKRGAEIWITDDGTNLSGEIKSRLQELKYRVEIVSLNDVETKTKNPKHVGGLVIVAPPDPVKDGFLKSAFILLQTVAPGLRSSAKNGGAMFVTVTRLDGEFGLTGLRSESYPVSGGLAGLAKTARHEWPEVYCKALDVSTNIDINKKSAGIIVDEMFIEGIVEVGISKNGRNALILKPRSISENDVVTKIKDDDVVIVAGGARGVTAEVSLALAKEYKPVLILLGRSREPQQEPDWMVSITDETNLKKAIIERSAKQISPKQVEEQFRSIIANREISGNIAKMQTVGSKVLYYSIDVRDAGAVKRLIAEVRSKYGPVNGLIYGAGVLADKLIEEKTIEQFETVYTTKVTGLLNLLKELENDELKFMALFSSFTGRYGRIGQVDYAVANEVLNKIAQQQSHIRSSCRVVSVNWGPWDGGMVTPSLKKVFQNENVELINTQVGANYLVKEICSKPDAPVEVIVMGSNRDENYDVNENEHSDARNSLEFVFEIDLNAEQHPFLLSHVIDNRAVLPMAVIIEWAAHAALHLNPGLIFHGFNDLRVLKGVTLSHSESCGIKFYVSKAVPDNGLYVVPVELQSIGKNGETIVHARAQIVLVERIPENKESGFKEILGTYNRNLDEIYNEILFHGQGFQGIVEVKHYDDSGISANVSCAPTPDKWIKSPLRNKWLSDPLAIDCSFQLMILWCFEKYQAGSLPCFAGKYRQYKRVLPSDGMRVVINVKKSDNRAAVADISFVNNNGECVGRIEDYESIISASLNKSFRKNSLSTEEMQTGVS